MSASPPASASPPFAAVAEALDAAGLGFVVCNSAGRFVSANRSFCVMLERSAEELAGLEASSLTHPDDHGVGRAFLVAPPTSVLSLHPRAQIEKRYLTKSGAAVPTRVTCFWTHDATLGWLALGIVDDLSEQHARAELVKLAEGRAWQAERVASLTRVAAGVAHEFNNLLGSILTNATTRRDLGTEGKEVLGEIEAAARRAGALSRAMLLYAGLGSIERRDLDWCSLVRAAEPAMIQRLPPGVSLELSIPATELRVAGDAVQLREVLSSLVTNAGEACAPRGGRVRVSLSTEEVVDPANYAPFAGEGFSAGRHAALEVSDDGEGMSDAVRGRIFDPFFSTKFAGRGLALATALGIVRGHRGAFSVESRCGGGSSFRVLLPLDDEARRSGKSSAAFGAVADPRACSVLVVDDEQLVRSSARRLLEFEGHQVSVASGGEEALQIFAAAVPPIDVVVLDVTMPGMDGFALLEALRRTQPALPAVMMSGYSKASLREKLDRFGVELFLEKPFDASRLASAVQAALARAARA